MIMKIKSKIANGPSFGFKLALKVGKLMLLWQPVLDYDHICLAAVLDYDHVCLAAVLDYDHICLAVVLD